MQSTARAPVYAVAAPPRWAVAPTLAGLPLLAAVSLVFVVACDARPSPRAADMRDIGAGFDLTAADGDGSSDALYPGSDVGHTDTAVAEAGSGACPGGAGCPCAQDSACESTGLCADSGDSPTGKACAFPFGSGCSAGFVSVTAPMGEGAAACVPSAPKLCNPCEKDADCQATGSTGALCIDRGAEGRFCGVACPASGCPADYACLPATSASGAKGTQCQPKAEKGKPGQCGCSKAAASLGLTAPCKVVGTGPSGKVIGTCDGQRACGPAGLGACVGKQPQAETCNGQDDDCNGQTDDGAACDDGQACTTGDACVAGKCAPGQPVNCNDTNVCTDDSCEPATGKCVNLASPASASCDDGDPCTLADGCVAGVCVGGAAKVCDGGPCTKATCLKSSGQCSFEGVPDATPCDDGNACTVGDQCSEGICQGGTYVCGGCQLDSQCPDDANPCNGVAFCDKSQKPAACGSKPGTVPLPGSSCSDGDACTTGETCMAGACLGGSKVTCDDAIACTLDSCDSSAGCVFAAASSKCDDGQPCTDDKCDKGKGCVHTAATSGGGCSDGNACTNGDTCGAGSCLPGSVTACDDGKACTVDACDPAKGCIFSAAAPGSACGDGQNCDATGTCTAPCGNLACQWPENCLNCPADCCAVGAKCGEQMVAIDVDGATYCAPDFPAWGNRPAIPPAQWFADNGDGTVTDSQSKLMWQKDSYVAGLKWVAAFAYCQNLDLGGKTDWRLPTCFELDTIVDFSAENPSTPAALATTEAADYWTASPRSQSASYAWQVNLAYGTSSLGNLPFPNMVRCVRN